MRENKQYYPVYLDLQGELCLIVGGGVTAARKAKGLLEAGAWVKVVAKDICAELCELGEEENPELLRRGYESGDIEGARMVFAATNDRAINRKVYKDAEARGILVNSVDDPENCRFIVPAVLRRGPVSISVSSGGRSPFLSGAIRDKLEKEIGPEYAEYAEMFGEMRDLAKAEGKSEEEKMAAYRQLEESAVLAYLRAGQREQAREVMRKCI